MTRYLIIGGTGTLGRELTRQISAKEPKAEITILSRDEMKQSEMKKKFPHAHYVVGDVRDKASIYRSFTGKDVVFHVAALKHVDVMELNPEESVRTNILGTMNVAQLCESEGVDSAVFCSTDKAVDPINVYGMSKGISETIWKGYNKGGTKFKVFRWGNVLGSRGSVLHAFSESLRKGEPARVTHPSMTRFWIKIEDAVSFMLDAYRLNPHEVAIPPMKAAKVTRIVASVARVLGVADPQLLFTTLRPGEKLHEFLTSQHSRNPISSETAEQFQDWQLDEMIRDVFCYFPVGGQ